MSGKLVSRVETACGELTDAGEAITFTAVAARAGISKATLYRHPELRSVIEEGHASQRESHTLSSIVVELNQLRHGLEAVAGKVRKQEEEIRSLRRRIAKQ